MKLHEIIEANENVTTSILVELMHPYKKLLLQYYNETFYPAEPILMVTDVFNACQYAKIVPDEDFEQCIDDYLQGVDDDDFEHAKEEINFNSIYFKNW